LGIGPDEVSQKDLNNSTYDVTHKKPETQNQNIFCIADTKACQIFWGFESAL